LTPCPRPKPAPTNSHKPHIINVMILINVHLMTTRHELWSRSV
jgi:hypothetical protein